ncbi:MAG: protein translocase subunit SecF [Desulfobacteraceae bacterium]|jgi:preprotein translocase subunit SecF
MQIIKHDVNINFVGRRKIAYGLSLIMILASIASLIAHGGPKYGIDFAGGAEILVQLDQPVVIENVKSALLDIGLEGSAVQNYGDGKGTNYRILVAAEQAGSTDLAAKIKDGLTEHTGAKIDEKSFSFEMVGPQVGRDLREKALLAMFFALLFITVYISGRFELKWFISAVMAVCLAMAVYALNLIELSIPALMLAALIVTLVLFWFLNLKYAMGAIVALIHDVTITVGLFSIFDKEFTLPIIAALLTIIGYSLNDTIIVFDRIRENLRKHHRDPLTSIINRSVNQTLGRTLLTSLTTLIVVIILFVLGGGIIHDFAFALIAGVLVGTYSSIFVASPILLAWQKRA